MAVTSEDRVIAGEETIEDILHKEHCVSLVFSSFDSLLKFEGYELLLKTPVMELSVEFIRAWQCRAAIEDSYYFASSDVDNRRTCHSSPSSAGMSEDTLPFQKHLPEAETLRIGCHHYLRTRTLVFRTRWARTEWLDITVAPREANDHHIISLEIFPEFILVVRSEFARSFLLESDSILRLRELFFFESFESDIEVFHIIPLRLEARRRKSVSEHKGFS